MKKKTELPLNLEIIKYKYKRYPAAHIFCSRQEKNQYKVVSNIECEWLVTDGALMDTQAHWQT